MKLKISFQNMAPKSQCIISPILVFFLFWLRWLYEMS